MLLCYDEATDQDTAFCLKTEGRLATGMPQGAIGLCLLEWHLHPVSRPDLSVNISIEERAQLVREIARLYLEWALNGSEDPEEKLARYATLGAWMDAEHLVVTFTDRADRGHPATGWTLFAEEVANLVYQSLVETASEVLSEMDEGVDPTSSDPLWREMEAALKPAEDLIVRVVRALPTREAWDRYVFQVRQAIRDAAIDQALTDAEDSAGEQAEVALVAAFVGERFASFVGRPLTFREEAELIGCLPGILESVSDDLLVAMLEHNLNLDVTDSAWVAIGRVIDAELFRRRPTPQAEASSSRHCA